MKLTAIALLTLLCSSFCLLTSCRPQDPHAGGDHDHPTPSGTSSAKDGDEGEDTGHDHDRIIGGPNGGRVLTKVEPHAEFYVMEDRKVQITFVDDDIQPIPAEAQSVSVIAGDRSNPTQLAFAKSGECLVSDKALPEGDDYPLIVQIKTTPDAEWVREKFNLDMSDCPTCDNLEYACICDH